MSAAKPIASTAAQWLTVVADCVWRLGAILRGDPRVSEIEIDPLRIYAKGTLALDVLINTEEQNVPSPLARGTRRRSCGLEGFWECLADVSASPASPCCLEATVVALMLAKPIIS